MDGLKVTDQNKELESADEAEIEELLDEELTDEQLLQMAEGSCSWGANCNRGC